MGSLRPDPRLEEDMSKRWYVVHAYSGFEKSVRKALEDRINRAGMTDKFGKILVPVEEVVEMKGGQKHMSERKFFPGYVLVEMEMDDDTWHLVKNTNKVTGFVGGTATKPAPIPEKEVDAIMQQMREGRSEERRVGKEGQDVSLSVACPPGKNPNKVPVFVGGTATKPAPIPEKEVDAIMQQMREGVEKPKPKVLFEVGEMVRVKDGTLDR